MERPAATLKTVQFGLFEVDLLARELRKSGIKIKLHDQPFQVLTVLLERPGQVVTREELHSRLWPSDTFVDFDLSLNGAVKKLRQALGDESDNPRFVETLYRRGYRFIAPVSAISPQNGDAVEMLTTPAPLQEVLPEGSDQRAPDVVSQSHSSRRNIALAVAAAALILIAGLVYLGLPGPAPRIVRFTQITSGGRVHPITSLETDGRRVYFQAADQDRLAVAEVSVEGGDSTLIATPFENIFLSGIAPDGSSLLITKFENTAKEGSAWFLPLPAGPPRPLGATISLHSAVWTPDGQYLLFVHDNDIYQAKPNGADAAKLASLPAGRS